MAMSVFFSVSAIFLGLLALVILGHFLGVAAGRLGILGGLRIDLDELAAEGFDLFLDRRTDVKGIDHGSHALRGGDRLQTGNARAQHEHAGRCHGAGGGHHHRKGAAIFGCGIKHGLVTGQIALRRQDVHVLRPTDARQQFQGECGDPCLGIGLDLGLVLQGGQVGNEDCPLFHQADLVYPLVGGQRPLNLQHDVGILQRLRFVLGDGRARRDKAFIGKRSALARSGLDNDVETHSHIFLDGVRRSGNARFIRTALLRNGDFHQVDPLLDVLFGRLTQEYPLPTFCQAIWFNWKYWQ